MSILRRRWGYALSVLVALAAILGALAAVRPWLARPSPVPPAAAPASKPALRVAQDGRGDFRTLAAALDSAGPSDTIRVLDDATYPESLVIDDPTRWRGLALESPQHATLEPPGGPAAAVRIANTPGVTLRGFRIRVLRIQQHAVLIEGDAAGVTLEQLITTQPPGSAWASLAISGEARGTAEAPIRVRGCTVTAGGLGVQLGGGTGEAVAYVEVDDNRFTGTGTHVLLDRAARDVSLHNNIFLGGSLGVSIHLTGHGQTRRLRVANNTWYRTRRWLGLARAEEAADVAIYTSRGQE